MGQLIINDTVPKTSDSQTCNYTHDDLARIASANCGSAWNQTFGYDPFGNITKNATVGTSFAPTYSTTTNQFTALSGITPTYDGDGRLTYDGVYNYTWDAESRLSTVSTSPSTTVTYDALGRMVETAVGTTYTEIVYSPLGNKFAVMSGQKLQKGFVPLATGAKAIYTSSGLTYYRHHDHLGSSRLATTPSKTLYSSTAYAPFGEPYKQAGTTDLSFTGQDQDTASGMHDFPDRRYMPVQGRWLTPDPAGLKAVSLANPQTWNRYAYVNNNPLALVDPFGDDDGCYSMGDASCEGQYYGGEDGWPSVSPPGINPTNGSIQNTNNTTPWDTPGTPGEFDVLDAELLLGITPGTPAALDALQNALNDAWGHGQDPGSNLQLLLTVSDALAGYLDVPDGFLINGLGEATQVEQNCANAAKAILTWIQQNGPGSPPSILLSGTATCAANAGSQLSPN